MIFPVELLDHMLVYVEEDPDHGPRTLKNFSYCNHLTCHLAQKRLFRDLRLVYSGYVDRQYHVCERINPPSHVQKFLLLAEESPHLLQHVQTLRISWPSATRAKIEKDMHETRPRTFVVISLLKNLKKVTFVDESRPHRWSEEQASVRWVELDHGLQSAFAHGFRFTNVVEFNFASITDLPPCVLAESPPTLEILTIATLYIIDYSKPTLPTSPPRCSLCHTECSSIAYWNSQSLTRNSARRNRPVLKSLTIASALDKTNRNNRSGCTHDWFRLHFCPIDMSSLSALRLMTPGSMGEAAGFERLLSTCSRTLERLHIDSYFEVQSYTNESERPDDDVCCDCVLANGCERPLLPRLRALLVDQLLYCTEDLIREGVRAEDLCYTLPGRWFKKLIKHFRPTLHGAAPSSFEEMVVYLDINFSESDEAHPNWADMILSVFQSSIFSGLRLSVIISDFTPTRYATTSDMLDDLRQSTSFKQLAAEGKLALSIQSIYMLY